MPKIACVCGEWVRYGDIPNKDEWLLISDIDYDAYSGTVDAEELYRQFRHALVCPRCKRVYVFMNGFSEKPLVYKPDD